MDFLQFFLSIVVPPTGFCILLLIWPALTIRSIILRLARALFEENLRGKVVILTGATSVLGEALAYKYAKRGAVLVVVSPNHDKLKVVAEGCKRNGAMDTHLICADVTKEEDCRRFIQETINRFGALHHLVHNAAISEGFLFEEAVDISTLRSIMDTDFWGYVYPTLHAVEHLKKTKGKIIVNASVLSWLPFPRLSIGGAAKGAIMNFFDTLRIELGNSIGGITIVTPGWIESEVTMGRFLDKHGNVEKREDKRDRYVGPVPVASAQDCAEAIIRGAARAQKYVRFPQWYTILLLFRVFAPEVLNFLLALLYMSPVIGRKDGATLSQVIMEIPGMKALLFPPSLRASTLCT